MVDGEWIMVMDDKQHWQLHWVGIEIDALMDALPNGSVNVWLHCIGV